MVDRKHGSVGTLNSWLAPSLSNVKSDGDLRLTNIATNLTASKASKETSQKQSLDAKIDTKLVEKIHDAESKQIQSTSSDGKKSVTPKKRKGRLSKLLREVNPAVFSEVDPSLNQGIDINNLRMTYPEKLWFHCTTHKTCSEHIWQSTIKARLAMRGCLFCNKSPAQRFCSCVTKQGIAKLLYLTHPDIFAEIDRSKHSDEEELKKLKSCSGQHLNLCSKTPFCKQCGQEHVWKVALPTRTVQGSGCPWCAIISSKFCRCHSLASRPDLVAELHPTKNGNICPDQIALYALLVKNTSGKHHRIAE